MEYFEAVQEGRKRAERAVAILRDAAGAASPLLFLSMGPGEWTPVGDESFYSVVSGKDGREAVVLCDPAGNSKAISPWLPPSEVGRLLSVLEGRQIQRHHGQVHLPV